jgi:L-threonylcarbamoyladenylate synthase
MEFEILKDAVNALKAGKIVALPTDTVWGLMADPREEMALERLYQLKNRQTDKPFQCLCAHVEVALFLSDLARADVKHDLERLSALWPGALTLLVPARADVPKRLQPGGVVGLRVPDFPSVQNFLEQVGGYAACTSLNLSGEPPVTTLEEARQHPELYDSLWYPGPSGGQASTVYHLLERRVVRRGEMTEAQILEVLQ